MLSRPILSLALLFVCSTALGAGVDPFSIELGQPFPRKANIPFKKNPSRFEIWGQFGVPAISGQPFADYQVQVNTATGHVIAVHGKRAFANIEECQAALVLLLPPIAAKFGFRPKAGRAPMVDSEDTVRKVQARCAFTEGGPYPELTLLIQHKAELVSVMEAERAPTKP